MLALGKDALSPTNPYRDSRTQFGDITLGGKNVLSLVAQASLLGQKGAYFHKWLVHRRLLPECFVVQSGLIIGVGVHRGHESLVDSHRIIEHLGNRRQAIGRAGSGGYDHVVLGELVMVDAIDDRQIDSVGGRGDDHAVGAGGKMGACLLFRCEYARAFQRNVDAKLLPRQGCRILCLRSP